MANGLQKKIESFITKYYTNQLIKGLIYGVGLSLFYFFAISVTEYFGRFSSNIRLALFTVLILGILFIVAYYILFPISKLLGLGKRISNQEAAKIIGKHFKEVDDKILNTLQLQEISEKDSDLLQASLDQRMLALQPVVFNRAVNFRENKKYWPVLVIPVLIFVALLASGRWDVVRDGSKRIVAYNNDFLPKAPFTFLLLNKELEVNQGDDYLLNLSFSGESVPDEARLVLGSGMSRMSKTQDGTFQVKLSNLQQSVDFRFEAAGFVSDSYKLEVLSVPIVNGFLLSVEPPKYTGIENYRTAVKLVHDVPEGSRLRWQLDVDEADEVGLIIDSVFEGFSNEQGNDFVFSKMAKESFEYEVLTRNSRVEKVNFGGNKVNVIKDKFPTVDVEIFADTLFSNTYYLRGEAQDDYGLKGAYLELSVKEGVQKISIPIPQGRLTVGLGQVLSLDSLVNNGVEEVGLTIVVRDNDGVNGSKSTRSRKFIVELLSKEQQKEKLAKEYKDYFNSEKSQQKDLQDLLDEMEQMKRKLLDKKSLSFNDKEKLKEILEKQKKVMENQRKNQEKLDKIQRQEEKLSKKDEEIKKKEEDLKQLSPKEEELQKLLEDIQKLMDKLDVKELAKKLDELAKENQKREQQMDRKDALLEDLKFQKDLLEQADKLQELAKKQEEMAKEEDPDKTDEELKEQTKVQDEFEDVKEKIKELKEEKEAFKKELDKEELDKESDKADEALKEAKENLNKKKQKSAGEKQQEAADSMEKMSELLQNAMMAMQAQQNSENMESLRQILDNLEELSFSVEEMAEKIKDLERSDPEFKSLLVRQEVLREGARVINDSLTALAERTPEIQQEVFTELEQIANNLTKSIDQLSELQFAHAAASEQFVMTSANNLAVMLDASLKAMQQMAANAKPGSQQCEKPGNKPGSKPGMAQIKAMQKGMGDKMGRMKEGGKEGEGSEGKNRGKSTEEMVKLLSEQEQLRSTLEQIEKESGNQGHNEALKEAIEQMKELEKEMLSGNITPEMLERVKEIESRLLEWEQAERKQKTDDKRESKQADPILQENSLDFHYYFKDLGPERESINRWPLDFNGYYKGQTNDYFVK